MRHLKPKVKLAGILILAGVVLYVFFSARS